eukprot:2852322-Amphidinium_carterae.2
MQCNFEHLHENAVVFHFGGFSEVSCLMLARGTCATTPSSSQFEACSTAGLCAAQDVQPAQMENAERAMPLTPHNHCTSPRPQSGHHELGGSSSAHVTLLHAPRQTHV